MNLSRRIALTIRENDTSIDKVVETLREYKLLSLLPSIKDAMEDLAGKDVEENTIEIESPFPLSKEAEARIKRIVGNDLAEARVAINKDLLAGFKARWKGKLYDGSAQRIINQLTH
jgi:F0F1-type ATP synthase delta subunit